MDQQHLCKVMYNYYEILTHYEVSNQDNLIIVFNCIIAVRRMEKTGAFSY